MYDYYYNNHKKGVPVQFTLYNAHCTGTYVHCTYNITYVHCKYNITL